MRYNMSFDEWLEETNREVKKETIAKANVGDTIVFTFVEGFHAMELDVGKPYRVRQVRHEIGTGEIKPIVTGNNGYDIRISTSIFNRVGV